MKARRVSQPLAALAIVACVGGGVASRGLEQPAVASVTGTLFREIARRQNPTVVSITTRSRVHSWNQREEEVFRLFDVVPPPAGERVQRSVASGFIISALGDILTNNHVVEGADTIDVGLFGEEKKRYRAIRIGGDPLSDSALIRLESPPPHLQIALLGDSDALEPGDWVMAIGNPFQLGHTVTVGVVSFERRPFPIQKGHWLDLIQTDASISPGNSGGPLINMLGEVVGINVAVLDTEDGSNIGIGFAVPINTVKALLPQLRKGKVVRGQLGVQLHDGPILDDEALELGLPEARGAIVMSVNGASTAAGAGLRAGDVIVAVDGHAVADTRDLIARTSAMAPGTRVSVTMFRDGAEDTRTIVIEELPVETAREAPAGAPQGDGGLTLDAIPPSGASRLGVPAGLDGALIVKVASGSPADEAELSVGDIIRVINRHPVHSASDARRELGRIEPGRPIFLLVWRHGTELFLQMRKD